ncbi:Ig-like domain-containing protein, partial [bacterium]|nr:Ig-like domain-containing protein [bacterium]MDC3158844.1 Ig-like domain-containing protein [bacterium]
MLMKLFNSKTIFLFLLCINYLHNAFSCAAIQAPSGGPKDDTPPFLLHSTPVTGAINFDQSIVQLFFSEHILERSIFDAISLLPKTNDPLKVKYKGKELVVKLPDNLLNDQTYILSINRNLKDENGVSLSEGIQLAFSTGNTIDKSKINGKLFSEEETSALLWKIRDSLDLKEFFLRQPDYTIDASKDGHFSFNYLSNGSYKILGLNRSKLNERLDSKYSIYGTSSTDIIKIDSVNTFKKDINILIPEASKYMRVVNGKWINNRRGEINFDVPVNEKLDYFTIEIISEEDRILPDLFVDNNKKNTLHFFIKDSLKSGLNTIINVVPRDNAEHSIIDSALILAKTKSNIDTSYLSIKDVEKMNNLEIEEDQIRPFDFSFSKVMYNVIMDSALTLKKDSVII